jgi:hypothetical protein
MLILSTFSASSVLANEKIIFDKGIGLYWYFGGETHFIYWTVSSVSDGWVKNFQKSLPLIPSVPSIPKDSKFYSYGLDMRSIRPPHMLGYGFAYVDLNGKKHGTYAARFIPLDGYKQETYEINFDGPLEKLKDKEIKYKFCAFIVGRGAPDIYQDAFLFTYEE